MPKVKSTPRGPKWTVTNVPTELPDWEAARVFLEVSRCGSFRGAAQKLGHSVNALRRTVERFEKDLGVRLLTRHVGGVQLTEEGKRICDAARRMESVSFDLMMARNASDAEAEGEVRISITEGLGTYWLLPRLARFQKDNPGLTVEMKCTQNPADLLRLEADLSIQLQRPTEPDLTVLKLGRLHMMLWVSRGYIAEHGHPKKLEELRGHRLSVLSGGDRNSWEADYQRVLRGLVPTSAVWLRTNSSYAHFWTIVGGAAIGSLPTYLAALGADLIPIELVDVPAHDIWLACHPNAKLISRVRKVMDFVIQTFDPRRAPWFRDEFIHPDRFAQLYKGPPLTGTLVGPTKNFF